MDNKWKYTVPVPVLAIMVSMDLVHFKVRNSLPYKQCFRMCSFLPILTWVGLSRTGTDKQKERVRYDQILFLKGIRKNILFE